MTTSITSGPTEGQKVQYARMLEDIARHATRIAFEQVQANSEGWQQVIARGDELKLTATEAIVARTRELSVIRGWREQDGIIYFEVVSDGTTGPEWIERLERKGFRLSKWAKDVLNSPDFKPTSGVTIEVAVLKGTLFSDGDRVTSNIRTQAYAGAFTKGRKLSDPNAELACLIREKFTDKEIEAMGLWAIVAMHEPINDSGGDPGLLDASRFDVGRWLGAYGGWLGGRWGRDDGFAFSIPQV